SDPQIRPPLRPPLLPYTTLFRSLPVQPHAAGTLELHGLAGFVHELRPLDAQLSEQLDRRFPAGATCAPHAGGSLEGLAALRQLRSEEHTSELQSRENLVCRLLLE